MPNWCKNLLKTSGKGAEKTIKDIINDKQEVDFELILPLPEELKDTIAPVEEHNQELIKKYGTNSWYVWQCINWGVKWNASRSIIRTDEDIIEFETPWGPPIEWLKALSQRHPKVKFKIQFADEFIGQWPLGECTIVNGEEIVNKTHKEGSEKAEKAADDIWFGEWYQGFEAVKKDK